MQLYAIVSLGARVEAEGLPELMDNKHFGNATEVDSYPGRKKY
jgi:hypothetical protein